LEGVQPINLLYPVLHRILELLPIVALKKMPQESP